MDEARIIGNAGRLPWRLPEDLQHFKELTMGQAVLMGRKTYESLPTKSRPLPGRYNIVATRTAADLNLPAAVEVVTDCERFLKELQSGVRRFATEQLWVIGGANLYELTKPYWDEVQLTLVKGVHQGDVRFPHFESDFRLNSEQVAATHSFRHYVRK